MGPLAVFPHHWRILKKCTEVLNEYFEKKKISEPQTEIAHNKFPDIPFAFIMVKRIDGLETR
jgi:hypothetical protein